MIERVNGLVMSLALGMVMGLCPARAAEIAPVSKAFSAWLDERTNQTIQAKTAERMTLGFASAGIAQGFGLRPHPFDTSYLSEIKSDQAESGTSRLKATISAPAYYDLRTLNLLTPVRNQNPYGTCWAHATLASLESWLRKHQSEIYSFSVNNLVNLSGFTYDLMNDLKQPYPWNGSNEGGSFWMSSAYLLRWSGPVSERDDPYPNPGRSVAYPAQCHVLGMKWILPKTTALDNSQIKEAILNYGALMASYCHRDEFLASDGKSYYCSTDYYACNHAVAIVGWDDTYSRSKFRNQPPGDGAYIVKNSWGSAWGENGYFYVSYYDKTMCSDVSMSISDVDTSGVYSRIYQYDELGQLASCYTAGPGTGYAANVFTSQAANDLSAVGFYALAPNTQYDITIRTNVQVSDPETGQVSSKVSGVVNDAGFSIVPLTTSVSVGEGEIFAVQIKLATLGYNFPIPFECKIPNYTDEMKASGCSFSSSDGKHWERFSFPDCGSVDACIKVYAKDPSPIQKSEVPISFNAMISDDGSAVNLTWEYPYSDVIFKLFKSDTNQRPDVPLAELTECSYRDEDVKLDGSYYYWLTAKRAGENFLESDSTLVSIVTPPSPPQIGFAKWCEWWPSEFFLAAAPSSSVVTTVFNMGDAIYFNLGWKNISQTAAAEFKIRVDLYSANGGESLGGWEYDNPAGLVGNAGAYWGDSQWGCLSGLKTGKYVLTVALDSDGVMNGPIVRTIDFEVVKRDGALPDLSFHCWKDWIHPLFITDKLGSSSAMSCICSTNDIYIGCGVLNQGTDDVTSSYAITFTLVNSLGGELWNWTYTCDPGYLGTGSGFLFDANINCRWNDFPRYPELDKLPPGEYLLRAELDSAGVIQEVSKDNNVAFYSFTVEPQCSVTDIIVEDQISFCSGGSSQWCGWSCQDDVLCSGFQPVGATNWIEIISYGSSKIRFYLSTNQKDGVLAYYSRDGLPYSDVPVDEYDGYPFILNEWTFSGGGKHVLRIACVSQSESACLFVGDLSREKARTIYYEPGLYGVGRPTYETESVDSDLWVKTTFYVRAGYYQYGWISSDGIIFEPTSYYAADEDLTLFPLWAEKSSLSVAVGAVGMDFDSSWSPWIVQSSVVRSGDTALCSGYLLGGAHPQSRLSTNVKGPGRLSFCWREDDPTGYDGELFWRVDRKEVSSDKITQHWDSQGWCCVTCTIEGNGDHFIEWIYERRFANGKEVPHCYLDDITWTPNVVAPVKPTGLTASDGTFSDKILVSWTTAEEVASYNLYRSVTETRPDSPTLTDVTSPCDDSAVTPGVKYYYWIEAVNSAGSVVSTSDTGYRAVSLSLGKSTDSYAAAGGSGSASVTANTSWSASADVDWITLGTSSGSGNGTLTYTVAANTSSESRTGTITVTASSGTSYPATPKTIAVTQNGGSIIVATPVISPADGSTFDTDSCTVTITCATEGATIYYSTNGSTPRQKDQFKYTQPFTVTETTTIKAVAVKDGFTQSEIAAATITKKDPPPLTLAFALDEPKLSAVETNGDAEWEPVKDATAVGGSSTRSGAIGMEQRTRLMATVYGRGTLSFSWKVSCEADYPGEYTYDHLTFSTVEGGRTNDIAKIDGETEWLPESVTFTTDGPHVILWTYSTDDWEEPGFEDCGWVDHVVWTGDAPPSDIVIPDVVTLPKAEVESFMAKYPSLAAQAGGDAETFAKLPSAAGKLDANGNQMYVWQDIIAGTDPTNPDDKFKIVDIKFENGELKVTWSPDLNENSMKSVRAYTEFGRKGLGGTEAWTNMKDVNPAEKNDYKFRKVMVDMP